VTCLWKMGQNHVQRDACLGDCRFESLTRVYCGIPFVWLGGGMRWMSCHDNRQLRILADQVTCISQSEERVMYIPAVDLD
jgi:hypothetical protein